MKVVAYFLRHGDTDANDADVFRGDIDYPLNKKGKEQAKELIPLFKGRKFSAAFVSTRTRAKQTIAPLMRDKKMKATPEKDLESLDTGAMAGLPKNDANLQVMKIYQENPKETIPGGEKVRTFRNRVDSALMSIIRKGEEAPYPTVVCTHGSVLKELSRLITGDMKSVRVDPGGVIAVFKDHNGYTLKAMHKPVDGSEEDRPGS